MDQKGYSVPGLSAGPICQVLQRAFKSALVFQHGLDVFEVRV